MQVPTSTCIVVLVAVLVALHLATYASHVALANRQRGGRKQI